MNDRSRALQILKQAREILLQRLTEHVLENEEEILSDARGESYMGEIDSLYEQIGTPLVHLNQILSNLPVEDDVHAHDAHAVHPAPHSYAEIVPPAWPRRLLPMGATWSSETMAAWHRRSMGCERPGDWTEWGGR